MTNLKAKAREFFRKNEVSEGMTHIAVMREARKSLWHSDYQFAKHHEDLMYFIGTHGHRLSNNNYEFFPIAELTDQSQAVCDKDCDMRINNNRAHKVDCAMYQPEQIEPMTFNSFFDELEKNRPSQPDDELRKLCTDYGVYLRSDECKPDEATPMELVLKQLEKAEKRLAISDAAMRLYCFGYDELIEELESENGQAL